MTPLGWLAAIVLFLQLPIPLYWFVVHPHVHFLRRHGNAGYITGLLLSWGAVTPCLVIFRRQFFRNNLPPVWEIIPGLALIVVEGWIFLRVKHDLGGARLVGATELSGGGEIVHRGIYAHIRHPRYIGSFFAVLGACLIAGTGIMWTATAVWLLLTLVAIELEEREMRARFGAAYEAYCRRVPRFLPLRAKPRES